MSDFDLLSAVQSDEGWFCVVGIKDKSVKQKFYKTREEVDQAARQLVNNNINAFFGVAKYKEPTSRKKENVLDLKALWLDIDCGEEKAKVNEKTGKPAGYADQAAGLTALMAFCKGTGLPRPIVVNSGRGLHVYWPLKKAVTREEWEPVADRLRQTCLNNNLYVDPAVFEAARVLRIPGTLNFKDDPPEEVKVVNYGNPVSLGDFSEKLGGATAPVVAKKPNKRPLSALTLALRGNETTLFDKIMRAKPGCAQLKSCYQDRATLSEPRWFNALSIAKFCEDKDVAIHAISGDHPDYNPAEVEAKIRHIVGPHTCEVFERNNPGGCNGCPYKGKFKSPIALGRDLSSKKEEAEGEEAEYEEGEEPTSFEKEIRKIPAYPHPYVKGPTGAILLVEKEVRSTDGELKKETETIVVYECALQIVKRMHDPEQGYVFVLKHYMPKDGIKQFVIPVSCMADKIGLRVELAKYNVLCSDKNYVHLAAYITAAIKNLLHERKAEDMRLQFGWADENSTFIIGDREITKDGTAHSPPSTATTEIASRMVPSGSLEKWKEVFNLYGKKGLEPHAFGALTAFGAPLFGFLGQSGAMINLINSQSGQGKSTILHMCNSVYGHPKKLCFTGDTLNGFVHKLGVHNNLPVCPDELTNIKAETLSDMIYCVSTGSGKDRMKQSTNALRANHTRWNLIALSTSNASFYDKLNFLKNNPDGEMMRVMEYHIEQTSVLDPTYAKQMFDQQLMENHGHAGDIYIKWVLNNLEEVISMVRDLQMKIDAALKLTQRERFWSAIVASNICGGLIAKNRCKLMDWDMNNIYQWACSMTEELRKDVSPPILNSMVVIGDYINRNLQNMLVVQDAPDPTTGKARLPTMEPRGELLIRYEPDTKLMYLSTKQFKSDCSKSQVSYKETVKMLETKGIMKKELNGTARLTKGMSKGMKVNSPVVHAIVLDTSHPEFAGMMDNMVAAATNDTGGVSEASGG